MRRRTRRGRTHRRRKASSFEVSEEYLRLEGGLVLSEREGRGAAILAEVNALLGARAQRPGRHAGGLPLLALAHADAHRGGRRSG